MLADWDALFAGHRHFSFFWLPSEASAELYGLATPPGQRMTDTCYVKVYDEAGDDLPDDPTPGRRVDRSYRIYPGEFDTNFHELEYFVPLERGREAVEAMRELMLASQPDAIFPLEVRTVAADDAHLSSNYRRATTVISVSGMPGQDYWPYLRARRQPARRIRRARALGQAALPHARAARRALSRERSLHRAAPRARSERRLPQRPPAAAVRMNSVL